MASTFNRSATVADHDPDSDHYDDGLDGDYSLIADVADADYPDAIDYYALLGVSSKPPPTDAEIRSAYRNLTLSFHPDKQPPHLREAAQRHFNQIQEAYDVLTDSQKRIVYDMLGAEGVKREWGNDGAMGSHGEAANQEVGVKTMSSDQFRRWFLKTMKKRERKAVESLVESHGTLTLGIDASETITVDGEDDVTFHIPSPELSTFGVNYSFNTPLSLPDFFRTKGNNSEDKDDSTEEPDPEDEEDGDLVQLTINAGVRGNLRKRTQRLTIEYEDGTEDVEVPIAPILAGNALELGATVTPNFKGLLGNRGVWNRFPFSFLKDSNVSFGALLLPTPALTTTFTGSYSPLLGAQPFNVAATGTIQRSLLESPPSFQIQTTKIIAKRKAAVLTWNSGVLQWPVFLTETFPALGMGVESFYTSMENPGQLQIGLVSFPESKTDTTEPEGGNWDDETQSQTNIDRSAERWNASLTLSPGGGGVALSYSRNLFSGKPMDDPVRTEWSSEGYLPMAKMNEARAVKLQVESVIGLDGSIQWTVKGTRRVGENTKIGLGMGISANNVAMTVHWKRLGQNINLPVILMPHRHHDAAVLATAIPWVAYCAIEFGYIRPRDRRKRRQEVARRHKELNKLIPKKRAESNQAIELMRDHVARRQAREKHHDGLVVTKAEYGYYPSQSKKPKSGFTEPRVMDATIPVASLVYGGQLVIPKERVKFKTPGFYDPAPLLPKRLKIWYNFQGQEHFVELGDKEGTACPIDKKAWHTATEIRHPRYFAKAKRISPDSPLINHLDLAATVLF
ncbi:unnamed protein product [Penicillium manginii]